MVGVNPPISPLRSNPLNSPPSATNPVNTGGVGGVDFSPSAISPPNLPLNSYSLFMHNYSLIHFTGGGWKPTLQRRFRGHYQMLLILR